MQGTSKRGARAASKGVAALVAMENEPNAPGRVDAATKITTKRKSKKQAHRAPRTQKAASPTHVGAVAAAALAPAPLADAPGGHDPAAATFPGLEGVHLSHPQVKLISARTGEHAKAKMHLEYAGLEDECVGAKAVCAANIDHYRCASQFSIVA